MDGIQLGIGFKPSGAFSDEAGLANLNTEPQRAQRKHRENTNKAIRGLATSDLCDLYISVTSV